MTEEPPYLVIERLVQERSHRTDREILAELQALPPLKDEDDAAWDDLAYWASSAYPFIALAKVVAIRQLRGGISLLLDRACFGDPGEIMRNLRHSLEAAVGDDVRLLADICLAAAQSTRPGTRLWAIDQLTILDDPRARETLEFAAVEEPEEIAWIARVGLRRLDEQV